PSAPMSEVDPIDAYQLDAYVNADRYLNQEVWEPILARLALKKVLGTYSKAGALDEMLALMETAAKRFVREVEDYRRTPWSRAVPREVREEVARDYVENFEAQYANGLLDRLLPEPYRARAPQPKPRHAPEPRRAASRTPRRGAPKPRRRG